MKKISTLTILLFLFSTLQSYACDNSTIAITNQVTNPDGSITYTLDLSVELGALDATFYGFTLSFNSPNNTPVVQSFPATLSNGDLSTGSLSETLFGLTNTDINSVVGDSDWNPYMNLTNVVSYEDGSIFGAASNDLSWTMQVTVMGCVETIEFNSSVNSGAAACIFTASTGVTCPAPCTISNLTAGTQTACNPADNTYTQEVVITYADEPASGTLDVNGQSFAITSSPQTVVLTGLTADGNAVDVTAQFSDNTTCPLTTNGLFTAPAACSATCTPDNGTWD